MSSRTVRISVQSTSGASGRVIVDVVKAKVRAPVGVCVLVGREAGRGL